MSLFSFSVKTSKREELINITTQVSDQIRNSGIKEGLCVVYTPHTTAAVVINESADPDVVRDIIKKISYLVPRNDNYSHSEGNSDAHIKASLIGNSRIIIIENGSLLLGTWEGIFFCEFDGPRTRKVYIKVI